MDLPRQGFLDVANLDGHDLQLAFENVTTLAVEMRHHHVPLLILIVLPPVPFNSLRVSLALSRRMEKLSKDLLWVLWSLLIHSMRLSKSLTLS